MAVALALARRALGQAWPNPAVGCVIVDQAGRVVGRGSTRAGGRPHAETEALACAGEQARRGTAYVTLEPCAHHGQTPPCAEALIAAGIARAVVAVEDPDPRVAGRGLELLRQAGIGVTLGIGKEEAEEINLGMEIMAECRRNPSIAKLFLDFESDVKARLVKLLETAAERGAINPSEDFESVAAMLMVIADGISLRRVADRSFDVERAMPLVFQAVENLLGKPAGQSGNEKVT